jgi:hypothetical protein
MYENKLFQDLFCVHSWPFFWLHMQHSTHLHVEMSEPRSLYYRFYWMRFHLLWGDNTRTKIRQVLIWWNDGHEDTSLLVKRDKWDLEPLEVPFLCDVHKANRQYRHKSCAWSEMCSGWSRPNQEFCNKMKVKFILIFTFYCTGLWRHVQSCKGIKKFWTDMLILSAKLEYAESEIGWFIRAPTKWPCCWQHEDVTGQNSHSPHFGPESGGSTFFETSESM